MKLDCIEIMTRKDNIWPLFWDLMQYMPDRISVVLVRSGNNPDEGGEFWREDLDKSVLESMLSEYEEYILTDGLTAISVFSDDSEIQLTDYKDLVVYAKDMKLYEFELSMHNLSLIHI